MQGDSRGDSPFQVVLDHMLRCFAVEEENARRHAESTKMLLTAIIAFLVLGLFRFGMDLFGPGRLGCPWEQIEKAILFLALASFLLAAQALLWHRVHWGARLRERWRRLLRRQSPPQRDPTSLSRDFLPASAFLLFEEGDLDGLEPPTAGTADHYRLLAIRRAVRAVSVLRGRNVRRDEEVRRARQWFVCGVALVMVALILYTLVSSEPSPTL
jgi:hypothetical protein